MGSGCFVWRTLWWMPVCVSGEATAEVGALKFDISNLRSAIQSVSRWDMFSLSLLLSLFLQELSLQRNIW